VYTNAGNSLREQILMILEQDFLEAGIKIIPKIVEGNFLVSEIIPNKKFDAVLLGWNASIKPDFTPLFASSQYLHPFHLTGYYSPEFDRLNQNMLDSKTMKEYSTRLNQLINHLVADQPCTWLFARKKIFVFNTKIKNVDVSMISTFKYLKHFKY
jgi:peptide/nickel transport system substrate-binding protein